MTRSFVGQMRLSFLRPSFLSQFDVSRAARTGPIENPPQVKNLPHWALLLLVASGLHAAVTGTVINRTTGQPQAGAVVALNRLGQNGIEMIDQAKSDAQGHFTINQPVQGPHVIRTAFDGVTYNHMLPPGTPTSDLTIDVYNSTATAGEAKVGKHMVIFNPTASGQMAVQEMVQYVNAGKTAWSNADTGELKFFLPSAAGGKAQVQATAPGGMPIPVALVPNQKGEVRGVDFPIKPGETRFDISYVLPYNPGTPYEGKIPTKDENTYLIVPPGVTLAGDGLTDLGVEPKSQDHIFGLPGNTYKITLTGASAPAADADSPAASQDQGPPIEAILPRIYGNVYVILGLSLAILAVGFVMLYRKSSAVPVPAAKEANERGRR
jgi:hypothetical protein